MNEKTTTEHWYYGHGWPVIEFRNEATGARSLLYCRSKVAVHYIVASGQMMFAGNYVSTYMSTKNFGDAVVIARQYCERSK